MGGKRELDDIKIGAKVETLDHSGWFKCFSKFKKGWIGRVTGKKILLPIKKNGKLDIQYTIKFKKFSVDDFHAGDKKAGISTTGPVSKEFKIRLREKKKRWELLKITPPTGIHEIHGDRTTLSKRLKKQLTSDPPRERKQKSIETRPSEKTSRYKKSSGKDANDAFNAYGLELGIHDPRV